MTGKEIIEQLKTNVHQKVTSEQLEALEISVKFTIKGDKFVFVDENEVTTANGVRKSNSFGSGFPQYKKLVEYFNHEKIEYLYIVADRDEVNVYANEVFEDCSLTVFPALQDPKQYIADRMNPHMKEGEVYASFCMMTDDGVYSEPFFEYKNGLKTKGQFSAFSIFDEEEVLLGLAMKELQIGFKQRTKNKITARKDQELEVVEFTPKDLIAEIKPFYEALDGGCDEMHCDIFFNYDESIDMLVAETDGYFIQDGKEIQIGCAPVDDYKLLYYHLKEKIDKLSIHLVDGELKIYAKEAFPELGIEVHTEVITVENDDLEGICKLIESGRDNKVAVALEAIRQNKATEQRLNKRYLNYVRAFLENEKATLQDLTADMFSEGTKDICGSYRPKIDQDYISFGYMDDHEAKRMIDFIGAMVQNYIDIDSFISEHNEAFENEVDEAKTDAMYDRWTKQLKEGITEEIKLLPDGWYSKTYERLMKIQVERVMLEKTEFYSDKRMPLLKHYMFFLNASANGEPLHFDIASSESHGLTEIFWMFRQMPGITWFQSDPLYPPNPYGDKKMAFMKVDNGSWDRVKDK